MRDSETLDLFPQEEEPHKHKEVKEGAGLALSPEERAMSLRDYAAHVREQRGAGKAKDSSSVRRETGYL